MSVQLTPIDQLHLDDEEREMIGLPNGEWMAATYLAAIMGEDVPKWNGAHDPQRYTPEQLRAIARRIEQLNSLRENLEYLAGQGGALLG